MLHLFTALWTSSHNGNQGVCFAVLLILNHHSYKMFCKYNLFLPRDDLPCRSLDECGLGLLWR